MTVKICLNMIVKNEEKVLDRLFKTHRLFFDAFLICDTGSTDGTVELIKKLKKKYHVPGRVIQHKWSDFATNRTLAIRECEKYIKEIRNPSDTWYLLNTDADNTIIYPEGTTKVNKDLFTGDYCMIKCFREGMTYHHLFLFRLSDNLHWIWEQPVHERLIVAKNSFVPGNKPIVKQMLSENLLMISGNDGGARKRDKFTFINDALKLEKYLLTPNEYKNPERLTYYLIQSYFSAKIYELAETYFFQLIKIVEGPRLDKINNLNTDWTEVHDFTYFAHYLYFKMMLIQQKKFDEKIFQIFMTGLKYNTKRLELPYAIMTYLRTVVKDLYLSYYLFKSLALENLQTNTMPVYPYTEISVYQYDFYEEMSTVAIFNKDIELFIKCVERCEANKDKVKNLNSSRLTDLDKKINLIKLNKWKTNI